MLVSVSSAEQISRAKSTRSVHVGFRVISRVGINIFKCRRPREHQQVRPNAHRQAICGQVIRIQHTHRDVYSDIDSSPLPYFFARPSSQSCSLPSRLAIAIDSEVAAQYHGPGNLASGCKKIRYAVRYVAATSRKVTNPASHHLTRDTDISYI